MLSMLDWNTAIFQARQVGRLIWADARRTARQVPHMLSPTLPRWDQQRYVLQYAEVRPQRRGVRRV
jgi:hypothetical protein